MESSGLTVRVPESWYYRLFQVFSFLLGAAIGSFLNVCIYRMPRDMAVNQPKRSFCPNCEAQIKWYHNLPIISWLWLRGKCGYCGVPISPRYLGVELLTGVLFLAIFERVHPLLLLPYWILASVLVVATFIDLEFYIIPNEITWGGVVAGVVLSGVFPLMMKVDSHWKSLLWSVCGAATGYFLLWGVVVMGKKAFGKKNFAMRQPTQFSWVPRPVETVDGIEKDADLVVGDIKWKSAPKPHFWEGFLKQLQRALGYLRMVRLSEAERGEKWVWSETFYDEKDVLTMVCQNATVDGEEFGGVTLKFTFNQLQIAERSWELETINQIDGVVLSLIFPREAMGFGDVKFIAAIGAFLGWQAVLFTVPVAAVCGSILGIGSMVIGKREWSAKIPFGPYLALGAFAWIFAGPELVLWYAGFLGR